MKFERPPRVRVIEGRVISYVEVFLPFGRHVTAIKSTPDVDATALALETLVDVSAMDNQELAMRISTDLDSRDAFFTDLNGFQMAKRKRMLDKLPIQANYYPVPSMAYIQDEKR